MRYTYKNICTGRYKDVEQKCWVAICRADYISTILNCPLYRLGEDLYSTIVTAIQSNAL